MASLNRVSCSSSQSQQSTAPVRDTLEFRSLDVSEVKVLEWGLLLPLNRILYERFMFWDNEDFDKVYRFGREPKNDYIFFARHFKHNTKTFELFSQIHKFHFEIYRERNDDEECGYVVYIKDIGENRTFVNGELVGKGKTCVLPHNAVIAVAYINNKVFKFTNLTITGNDKDLPDIFQEKYFLERIILGEGATGVVHLGRNRLTQKKVAVKIIKKSKQLTAVQYEAELMKKLEHRNVVKIEEVFETDEGFYFVLEFMAGGELFELIKQKRVLSEEISKALFHQLLNGILYLHENNIIHRDLKPENVLLSTHDIENCTVKIADFGWSRAVGEDSLLKSCGGTFIYWAPEIFKNKGYTKAVDAWSAGCILFIMLSGTPPFTCNTLDSYAELRNQVCNEEVSLNGGVWQTISDSAKNLVSNLLKVDPQERISISSALDHEWF